MKARNFGVEDYVRFHPGGSLGASLMTVEQSMMFRPGEKLAIANQSDTIEYMLENTNDVKRHGAVMVVDSDEKLVGIITDADLRRLLTQEGPSVLKKKPQML
jgi:arabinose-5-phosphate isomerase